MDEFRFSEQGDKIPEALINILTKTTYTFLGDIMAKTESKKRVPLFVSTSSMIGDMVELNSFIPDLPEDELNKLVRIDFIILN